MRRPLRYSTLAAVVAATIVLATPVAAAGRWTVFKQSGTSAVASTSECLEEGDIVSCTSESVSVFTGTITAPGEARRAGEEVCYSSFTETFNASTGQVIEHRSLFGCTSDAGTLTVNRLSSISLETTYVELTFTECNAVECTEIPTGRTIAVYGTWTGVGPIQSQKGKFAFDDGSCLQLDAQRGRFRQASFIGSIDAIDAHLGQGSFTFRTTCQF